MCDGNYPLNMFHSNKSQRDGLNTYCKTCQNKENARRKAEKKKDKVAFRRSNYATELRKYGITLQQYDEMLYNQDGCCLGCCITIEEYGKHFAVDHCHSTGKIRGLLCGPCNLALGYVRDSPQVLRWLVNYLESYEPE